MAQKSQCLICAHPGAPEHEATSVVPARHVLVGDRLVMLCESHAATLRHHRITNLLDLRRLFVESGGRRSLVDRRDPLDRRAFPPRPEGRRAPRGRRATDPR
jgi:hypothetical protein